MAHDHHEHDEHAPLLTETQLRVRALESLLAEKGSSIRERSFCPSARPMVFHEEWERRVFALNLTMGAWGKWTIDMGRYAREQMPPAE